MISLSAYLVFQLWYYIYVDNFGVLGFEADRVHDAFRGLCDKFEENRLVVHEKVEHSSSVCEILGVSLDIGQFCTSVTNRRYWRVYDALGYILRVGKCSGEVLEVLIGHCTYCSLVNRKLMSIFSACYAFMRSSYAVCVPLWKSVVMNLKFLEVL